jgi:hypothetical protein
VGPERATRSTPSAAEKPFPIAPLFSYSYKPLFAQPLCIHIHTKPRGCRADVPAFRHSAHVILPSFRRAKNADAR